MEGFIPGDRSQCGGQGNRDQDIKHGKRMEGTDCVGGECYKLSGNRYPVKN